jgi:hypothetical protein
MQPGSRRTLFEPQLQEQAIHGIFRLSVLLLVGLMFSLMNYLLYRYLGLSYWYLSLLMLPWIALAVSLWVGGRFINHLYNLGSTKSGMKHLVAVLFGIFYPDLKIGAEEADKKGDSTAKETEEDAEGAIGESDEGGQTGGTLPEVKKPLLSTSGPGRITVPPGYAVVVENLFGKVGVLREGEQFISSQDWIKESVNLEERERWIPFIKTTSSDGIPVEITDVRYRYRICSQVPRTPQEPYPFEDAALLNMVYNRPMLKTGVFGWDDGIKLMVEGIITEYINRHPIDQLTAPGIDCDDEEEQIGDSSPCNPRQEIANRFKDAGVLKSFIERGADLTWFDMGHVSLPDPAVAEQRLKIWQTRWDNDANRMLTEAESQRLIIQDRGRAEAQADMLMSIVHALEDIDLEGDSRQHVRDLVLIRTAQILDALGERPANNEP